MCYWSEFYDYILLKIKHPLYVFIIERIHESLNIDNTPVSVYGFLVQIFSHLNISLVNDPQNVSLN